MDTLSREDIIIIALILGARDIGRFVAEMEREVLRRGLARRVLPHTRPTDILIELVRRHREELLRDYPDQLVRLARRVASRVGS